MLFHSAGQDIPALDRRGSIRHKSFHSAAVRKETGGEPCRAVDTTTTASHVGAAVHPQRWRRRPHEETPRSIKGQGDAIEAGRQDREACGGARVLDLQVDEQVTHLLGVLGFGGFCYILGARPQDVPYVYCLFYVTFVPLRWIYYRYKKWHYYLLDFCYYANTIFIVALLFFPKNEKLFMICFAFAEGPLAWAIIVWRCSLVFSSADKIVSVLIHLLPGVVFFTIRWWDPATFAAMHPLGTAKRASWPYIEDKSYLWTWLFVVPLAVYTLWQLLYSLIVNVLRRQRLLSDPEIMTSYRELSKKAQKANGIWWHFSGLLGDQNRNLMYIFLQAVFTVATMALAVPIFLSYRMHLIFQFLKVCASIWYGGNFLVEVMPRQVVQKEKKKLEMKPIVDAQTSIQKED